MGNNCFCNYLCKVIKTTTVNLLVFIYISNMFFFKLVYGFFLNMPSIIICKNNVFIEQLWLNAIGCLYDSHSSKRNMLYFHFFALVVSWCRWVLPLVDVSAGKWGMECLNTSLYLHSCWKKLEYLNAHEKTIYKLWLRLLSYM